MSKTHVPLDQLRDNPHQPRLDIGDIEGLAETILQHGLRQLPEARLVVDGEHWTGSYSSRTKRVDGEWRLRDRESEVQLASGHRRVAAIQLLNDDETVTKAELANAGLVPGHAPVDLQRLSDSEMLDLLTIENAQREELSPIEEARLIQELAEDSRANEEIGMHFGNSASWVSNRKRLTELPTYVQEHVHEGDLSVRQAQALTAAFAVEDEHPDLVQRINVDLRPGNMVSKAVEGHATSDDIRDWTRELADVVERVEESKEGDTKDSDTTTETDEREAPEQPGSQESNGRSEDDAVEESGAPTGQRGDDRRQTGPGPDAEGDETGLDETKRAESAGEASKVSGDGAPSTDSSTGHPAHLTMVIDAIERKGWRWKLQSLETDHYQGTVQKVGTSHLSEGVTPAQALQAAYEMAGDVPADDIGTVDRSDVDRLLSADGEDMWNDQAAEKASIASLLVAHRVAGRRQETWRTRLIAEVVQDRVGQVTGEDVPDDVMDEVRSEVGRRLQAV